MVITAFLQKPWKLFVALVFLAGAVAIASYLSPNISTVSVMRGEALDHSPKQFSDDLDLLLNGDRTQASEMARWKAVPEAFPKSALHYARFLQNTEGLPEDFRTTIHDIAPHNAWFDVWQIAQSTPAFLKKLPWEQREEEPPPHQPERYQILNPDGLTDAINLYHAAAEKEDFTSYFFELQSLLQDELESPKTYLEEITYRSNVLKISPSILDRQALTLFIGAAFQHLIDENDHEGFLKLEVSSRQLAPKLLADSHDPLGALTTLVWMRTFYQQALAGASRFQLPELTTKYRNLCEKMEARDAKMADHRDGPEATENEYIIKLHGSIMVRLGNTSNFTSKPFSITRENLNSSCRAENAVLSRIFTIAIFCIFTAFALDLWVITLRPSLSENPEILNRLEQLTSLIHWKAFLFGVIIPFFLLLSLRYLTPLGQLHYSAFSSKFTHLALPILASSLVVTAAIICATRYSVAPAPKNPLHDLAPVLPPLASFLVIGTYFSPNRSYTTIWVSGFLNLASILWLLCIAFRFHRQKNATKYLKARLALPAFFLAAGLFGLWTWFLGQEEKSWIANDEFATPEAHFTTKHEAKMTRDFLAELEAMLP